MTVENTLATRPRGYVVDIKSLAEAMEYAKVLANTDMVPDGDKGDRKSTRLNSSHSQQSRMPSSA